MMTHDEGHGMPPGTYHDLRLPYLFYGTKFLVLAGLLVLQIGSLRRHPELAQASLTRDVVRRFLRRTALFATIPLLSMAAVFYNTRLALYLYFLLLIVHFLPGRVDMPASTGKRPSR